VIPDLVIIGSGGHAREILDIVESLNEDGRCLAPIGFLDDDPARHDLEVRGLPVLGGLEWFRSRAGAGVRYVVGIGASSVRRRVVAQITELGGAAATLIHPTAVVGRGVELGPGCVLTAYTILTTNIRLGVHVHLNLAASISHDCVIGDFCTLAPGARLAGNIRIGDGCELGLNAVVVQGTTIGEWTIVGAGTVVTQPLPSHVTAVGAPARIIKKRSPTWYLD
jgi:sugar O-acyltransferase (sialic acid O-acetyltransferase NeuD family)